MVNRKAWVILLYAIFLFVGRTGTAQEYKTYKEIVNRWQSGLKIHPDRGVGESSRRGDAQATEIELGALGAKWYFEPVEGTKYVRLENGFEEMYLHAEFGILEVGEIIPDWKGALWNIEKVPNTDYVEIRNVSTGGYLHVEHGGLELGTRTPGWHSAMWELKNLPLDKVQKWTKDAAPVVTFPPEGGKTGIVTNQPNSENGFEWRFEWEKMAGARGYEVYVSRDGAQKPLVEFMNSNREYFVFKFEQGSFIPDSNLTGWFFNVRAIVNNAPTAWSKRRYFTVAPCQKNAIAVTNENVPVLPAKDQAVAASKSETALMYTLEINYNGYGTLNNTGTKDKITITLLDADRGVLFNQPYLTFTTPANVFTVTFASEKAIASIRVQTEGSDAFWIDKMSLKKENTVLGSWGKIGGKGWCLSNDANDGLTTPLKDYITPSEGCRSCFEFQVNGKVVECNLNEGY